MAAQPTFLAPPPPVAEPIEDHRITRARQVLSYSQAADSIEVISERTP